MFKITELWYIGKKNEFLQILKLDKLVSWPSEWFTTSDLLTKLDCECAQLNETNLDCRAFKAFMLKWKMLDNTRLKMLEISFDGDWTLFNYDGLDAKKWNPEERDGHYPLVLRFSPRVVNLRKNNRNFSHFIKKSVVSNYLPN